MVMWIGQTDRRVQLRKARNDRAGRETHLTPVTRRWSVKAGDSGGRAPRSVLRRRTAVACHRTLSRRERSRP